MTEQCGEGIQSLHSPRYHFIGMSPFVTEATMAGICICICPDTPCAHKSKMRACMLLKCWGRAGGRTAPERYLGVEHLTRGSPHLEGLYLSHFKGLQPLTIFALLSPPRGSHKMPLLSPPPSVVRFLLYGFCVFLLEFTLRSFLDIAPPLETSQQPPVVPGLHHLVVATKRRPGLELLLASSARFGYRTTVLGSNESRPLGHWSKAFGLKMILMHEAVAALPPDDWVLFTDAYDVVFQRPALELLAALEEWEASSNGSSPSGRLLFTAEVYEWPDVNGPYTTRHLRLPFLNSGVYAGRARHVLRAVSSGYDLNTDDQRFFTQQMFGTGGGAPSPTLPTIVIDHEARYFSCMAGLPVQDFALWPPGAAAPYPLVVPIEGGGVVGTPPFVLHFNGANGKVHLFWAVQHVLGEGGAFLAERPAWEGGVSFILLGPSRELMILMLPWKARLFLHNHKLADAAAIAISVMCLVGLWVLRRVWLEGENELLEEKRRSAL